MAKQQVIWRGKYRFDSREAMYAAIVAVRRLVARSPHPPTLAVLGTELTVVAKVPTLEDTVSEVFDLLAGAARTRYLDARLEAA